MDNKQIPICPLKSAGSEFDIICSQERCAWYVKPFKMCCIYMIGHKAAMDIQEKQESHELF